MVLGHPVVQAARGGVGLVRQPVQLGSAPLARGLGHRLDNKPAELSGGQQQRVAIARSLANDPAIILADEPTANLDSATGKEIIALMVKLQKERGVTIISATHDHEMLAVSDRVLWIKDGTVERVELRADLHISAGTIG